MGGEFVANGLIGFSPGRPFLEAHIQRILYHHRQLNKHLIWERYELDTHQLPKKKREIRSNFCGH